VPPTHASIGKWCTNWCLMRGGNINAISEKAGMKHAKLNWCSVGLWARRFKSERFFLTAATGSFGKSSKGWQWEEGYLHAYRLVFGLEKSGFESCLCHRLPMWLVAQLCASNSAGLPHLQGYSKNECIEDRTSQTLILALHIVLAEQTRVREQECRIALC